MDVKQFADFLLNLIILVLPSVTSGALERIGAGVIESPFNLYKLIKNKFNENAEAKKALENLELDPESKDFQNQFRKNLIKNLEGDTDFSTTLGNCLININFGSFTILGNHNQINQSLGKVASTLIEVNPKQVETINFVLNIVGNGPGTVGDALQKLNPLHSPMPALNVNEINLEKIYTQVQRIISEHSLELKFDVNMISELLDPAVSREKKEEYPLPGRFLRRVVSEIGKKFDEALLFDSGFSSYERPHNFQLPADADGFRSKIYKNKLLMPQLAMEFDRNQDNLYLVKNTTKWDFVNEQKEQSRQKTHFRLLKKETAEKRRDDDISFDLEYDGVPVIQHGEYHIKFDETLESMIWDSSDGLRSKNVKGKGKSKQQKTINLPISADVLGKFLRAIIHDYISYMRYPNTVRAYLDSYKK